MPPGPLLGLWKSPQHSSRFCFSIFIPDSDGDHLPSGLDLEELLGETLLHSFSIIYFVLRGQSQIDMLPGSVKEVGCEGA